MDSSSINKNIRLIADGDLNALGFIYQILKTHVYGLALSIVKDRGLAEDVMQSTFLKLRLNAGRFTREFSGKAWILRIARNEALDCLKKRREILYDDPGILSGADSYDGNIEKATNSVVIQEAMKVLTPEENQIVFLHLYCDLKHREIAKILGIPPGTAGRIYSEAIRKLRLSISPESTCKSKEAYI